MAIVQASTSNIDSGFCLRDWDGNPDPRKVGIVKKSTIPRCHNFARNVGMAIPTFPPTMQEHSQFSFFFLKAPQLRWDDNRIVSKYAVAQGMSWDCAGIV